LEERKNEVEFVCEPLGPRHDRAAFSCESIPLDSYLKTQARQDVEKRLAAIFILTPDRRTIAGYYTLSQYSVEADAIPEEITRKLTKHHSIPATLIGRLARNVAFKGEGLGDLLLMDALERCYAHSKEVGSWAVIVDAKDAKAAAFYKRHGFVEIPQNPQKLFLPMETISKLVK
jgi:predicted GNAT family N-acyltransferase